MKKRILFLTSALALILSFSLCFFANAAQPQKKFLVDEAALLSESDYNSLSDKLIEINSRLNADVVIVTVNSFDGKSSQAFADDYFDYNGYGQGDNNNGILLALSMNERNWAVSTTGSCIKAFTDSGLDTIMSVVKPKMSNGAYFDAFTTFADKCDKYITYYNEKGKPYTEHSVKDYVIYFGVAILLAIVVAFIIVNSMKAKLKTVRFNDSAADYTRDGSMHLIAQNDMYLYSNVTRTEIPKSNSGSSTHTGSSGTSHGGSSGSF